jgi:hypothetical protein
MLGIGTETAAQQSHETLEALVDVGHVRTQRETQPIG